VGTIVVGVDGSPGAEEALDYAVREAKEKGAALRIVSAWHVPTMAYAGGMAAPLDPETFREGAEAAARDAAARASDAQLETVVEEGQAADVLLEAAKDADLLVVGSRGLGGFTGLLLGSVSQQVAHYAHCPVVIVRGREHASA
jgi:nucleotide-binding universal stress UspA family protein